MYMDAQVDGDSENRQLYFATCISTSHLVTAGFRRQVNREYF